MAASVSKNGGTSTVEPFKSVAAMTCKHMALHRSTGLPASPELAHAGAEKRASKHTPSTVLTFKRDFLLFIPATAPNLHAVMSYFSATMKVNPEGDVLVNDDTIHGLGTAQRFLQFFFGSLLLVARTPPTSFPSDYNASLEMASPPAPSLAHSQTLPPRSEVAEELDASRTEVPTGLVESLGTVLIACVPHTGYFVAGGIAGIVSRTSTAPLDRLKVYLIAQTGAAAEQAVVAAKSGNIISAVRNAWTPLATAMKELWQAGGMRSLYAGKSRAKFVCDVH